MSNAWYPRYAGDYGRDTSHLSLTDHGAYTLLLDWYYSTRGPIPKEKSAHYRICRAVGKRERAAVDLVMRNFFQMRDDGWHNSRADSELAKQAELKERLSRNGRKGAEKTWSLHGRANGPASGPASSPANGEANSPTMAPGMAYPQPQPQPQKEKATPLGGDAARESERPTLPLDKASGFGLFKAAYPRKKNMAAARKAWEKNVKPEEVGFVLARLEIFKLGEWKTKEMQYIPYPATWLNGHRWEDEIESPQDDKKGGTSNANGDRNKHTSFAEQRSQKSAAAIETVLGRFEKAPGDIRRALPAAN